MPATDIIRIRNASFYAYHGVAADEQNLGGKFEVDVELRADLSAAMKDDKLSRTINYEAVYGFIQETVTARKYFLLEALAGTLARNILKRFRAVRSAKITVRKPHPPVKGVIDYVEVEITRSRR